MQLGLDAEQDCRSYHSDFQEQRIRELVQSGPSLAAGQPDIWHYTDCSQPLTTMPHLLYVVNVDWFFLSHRLPQAKAALAAGFRVTIAAGDTGQGDLIRAEGMAFEPLTLSRGGTRLGTEGGALLALLALYGRLRPDIVHHVTIKPVLYGSLAARMRRVPGVVNAVSGLGYVLTADGRRPVLARAVKAMYRAALRHPNMLTIFQNPDDLRVFTNERLVEVENARLIRGSGVDCLKFTARPEPAGTPVVLLPARMLWDKGIRQFVDAAVVLKHRQVSARLVLSGMEDPDNPTAVPTSQIQEWVDAGLVEWWGPRDDMEGVLAASTLVVLPSRREGLPKVLLEAAASGRAMVATDVPGCREVVRHRETGLLVPLDDHVALADAIQLLLEDPSLRRKYGQNARVAAETEFADSIIADQVLGLYHELTA